MNTVTEEIVTLLIVIAFGLLLGKVGVKGIRLGSSGVVFVALAAGHLGFQVPAVSGVAGILLFVYCLGLGAGPGFLRTVVSQGKSLAVMASAMIIAAGAITYLLATGLGFSPDLAAGLFAGAMTSTPALAAATDQLPDSAELAVGFGVAYPFGVIVVILFVQLMPKAFPAAATKSEHAAGSPGHGKIARVIVKITNPRMAGKRLREVSTLAHSNCQISRVLIDNRMQPIPSEFCLQLEQRVLLIGAEARVADVIETLGELCEEDDYVLDMERQRRRVVVTSSNLIGKSLQELHLLSKFGVTISRITRLDVEFVPGSEERIQFGDALTAVGESAGLDKFFLFAGHRDRTLDETDIVSLSLGLVLGILAGQVTLTFAGESISLGLAGGPLLVGLMLGHMGRIGPVFARMPRAARFLLSEIGLVLFLAQAGTKAGGQLVAVIQSHGVSLPLAAIAIVSVPLLVGLLVSRFVLNLDPREAAGGICGAMTSTPGLGAVTSGEDSSLPATSYAAVYPLALVLITLLAPLLIAQLS